MKNTWTSTRRQFLSQALASGAFLSLSGAAPSFLRQVAAAEGENKDRVLVVIQLSGGNDGLNTIIPYKNEEYRKNRPTLGIADDTILKINDEIGFHPAFKGAADLLQRNQFAIVHGVGYEHPNRSHFESMDIWHTCHLKGERRNEGWLGQYLETMASLKLDDALGMHLGEEVQPLALAARDIRVPSVASLEKFRLQKGAGEIERAIPELVMKREETAELLNFVQTSTVAALAASQRVEEILKNAKDRGNYPASALGKKLQTVSQLISAGMQTRVYYVALDGFDTHSQQPAAHAALLGQLGDALQAFMADLTELGQDKRVLVLSFSEFGRRLKENASEGTDHGAAAPVFLAGGAIQPGIHGAYPSLTDLDDGDLKHHTDFRQVYAAILERWLGCPSEPILGGKYEPIGAI